MTTIQKRGGEQFSFPKGLQDGFTSSLHRCGKGVDVADTIDIEDQHRGL
jgi:hypothetical protein